MNTESLIRTLASGALRIKPLARPMRRYLYWLALAIPFVALSTAGIGVRADLSTAFTPTYLLQVSCLLLLALTAAASAFSLAAPGRSTAATLWVPALIALACTVVFLAPALTETRHDVGTGFRCLRNILLLTLPPAAVLFTMLWRAFPLAGNQAGLLAFLGTAALGCLATRFICPREAMLHFFIWHCLPVVGLASMGALLGHWLLRKV